MKKLDFKKPEAKPATVIETTHADLAVKKQQKKKRNDIVVKKKDKRESKTTSIRLYADEIEKINKYLEENDIRFVELIRALLKKEGIL